MYHYQHGNMMESKGREDNTSLGSNKERERAFSSATKLHSPMIPIRVDAPIITFVNISIEMMHNINSARSLIVH